MTASGKLISLFPLLHLCLIAGATMHFAGSPGVFSLGVTLATIYLIPPLAFRLQEQIVALRPGKFRLTDPVYSPWWGSYQMQQLFIACPFLESLLRLVPGAYSAWLRLWGSRIGRRVQWTPRVEILDRSLLHIGDDVIVGHEAKLICHYIRQMQDGRLVLKVGGIRIGDRCLIGGGVRIGPDVKIEADVKLDILADVYSGSHIEAGTAVAQRELVMPRRMRRAMT